MLEIKNLCISYDDLDVISNQDLSFDIGITCIIGQSGSGKSSILNALNKRIAFNASSYSFGNIDALNDDDFSRKYISYLIQGNNFIEDLTCFENIRFYANLAGIIINDEDIQAYLHQVGLSEITSKHYPNQLSGGERQRLALVYALVKDAPIILCDEITASLDMDNKKVIISLLKKIALQHQKIVIITSHDEDIFDLCDKVYEVKEGKVHLNKDFCVTENVVVKTKEVQYLSIKHFNSYVMGKLDRQKWVAFIYGLISSVVVALCAFLVFYTADTLIEQNRILDRLTENQINIINQTIPNTGVGTYLYQPENQIFDSEVVEQLENIEHLSSLYPYYWISLSDEGYQERTFVLSYANKEDKEIVVGMSPYEYSIIPYYDEQNFENKMTIINKENQAFGVYINENFLVSSGLTQEDLVGATIKVTAYPPVALYEQESSLYFPQEKRTIDILMHMPKGQGIEIKLPILGVVDFWYNEERTANFIYCPIAYMEQIRNEVSSTYELDENEFVWQPNAYSGFVDDLSQLENVNLSIRKLDDTITTGNRYMDNTNYYQQKSYVEKTMIFALFIVLISGSILSYAYGIFYYQQNQNDIEYFRRNGIVFKELKKLVALDIVYQSISNILFATPMLIIVAYIGQVKLNMWRFGFVSSRSFYLMILMIAFSFIQGTVSRLYYYKKIK